MVAPINVLAFIQQFYLQETNASIQKYLEQLMYAAPVYSSTKNVRELF